MYTLDNFSCICITILLLCILVLLMIAYIKQRKIVKEMQRDRLEREKRKAQMNES
jgi:hypothetical protein